MSIQEHALIDAVIFATDAHGDQRYGDGPYILHPLRVAARAQESGCRVELVIAAILHDVVEDTDVPLETIRVRFGAEVARLVDAVSRRDGETYEGFIDRVITSGTPAAHVKRLDIMENLSKNPREKNRIRYEAALAKIDQYIFGDAGVVFPQDRG